MTQARISSKILLAFNLAGLRSSEEPQDQDISNVEELENCRAVVQLTNNAVEREDWPKEHDTTRSDNYPDGGGFVGGFVGVSLSMMTRGRSFAGPSERI